MPPPKKQTFLNFLAIIYGVKNDFHFHFFVLLQAFVLSARSEIVQNFGAIRSANMYVSSQTYVNERRKKFARRRDKMRRENVWQVPTIFSSGFS